LKLFAKYNRINIAATIIIFLAGSCTFYFLLRYILVHQLDETLHAEQQEVVEYVAAHHQLPDVSNSKGQHISFVRTAYIAKAHHFSSLQDYDHGRQWYREIAFGVDINGTYYLATVSKPLEETEDLLQIIISVTIAMIALVLLVAYAINRRVLGKLWQPFYFSIEKMRSYDVNKDSSIDLPTTNIDEFRLLNESATAMTERIQTDYRSLKEFTGQAAHEMQTPLAIIRTRLDMLIQNEDLAGRNQQQLLDIERSVSKLSRLYQSLLLLTRIENRQFALNENVALDKILNEKMQEYAELAEAKQLKIKLSVLPYTICFHPLLADIIVSNLINNAIRYNIPNGHIDISLQQGVLTIANTSEISALDEQKVFQRFYRHQQARPDGNGLGLSIVKQICDLGSFSLQYQYDNEEHQFSIKFA